MYTKLLVRNIKNTSGEFQLGNTTILRGPNESGKTAILEALRLAVTGRAEVGGTGGLISEIVCGGSASAIAIHSKGSSSWKCKVGSSVSCDRDAAIDTQLNMPISVDAFWALSNVERFALLAGGNICAVTADIDKTKAEVAAQEKIAGQASVAIPDMYDGLPVEKIMEELDGLSAELHINSEATKKHAAVNASLSRDKANLITLKETLSANGVAIQLMTKEIVKTETLINKLERLAAVRKDAAAREPKLIAWGRDKGLNMQSLCIHFISNLAAACEWAAQQPGAMIEVTHGYRRLGELLSEMGVPSHVMEIPALSHEGEDELLVITKGKPIDAEITKLKGLVATHKKDLEKDKKQGDAINRDITALEHSLALASAVHATPVEAEVLEAMLERKSELTQQAEKCRAWERFDAMNGDRLVAISKASIEIDRLDDQLQALNKERDSIVLSILSPIEEGANSILRRAGLPDIKLDITATAKTASLDVRTGGVSVKALAKSRKLMYGICLLSAIQQQSDAVSPVLLAQCAEMDIACFKRCVDALNVPRRGNVVLEHWADVTQVGVVDVDLSKPELAKTA